MRNTLTIVLDIMNASKDPREESRNTRIKELCGELLVKDTSDTKVSNSTSRREPNHTPNYPTNQCIYVTRMNSSHYLK